jgi:DNA-binding NarL/FixJ family response regulator
MPATSATRVLVVDAHPALAHLVHELLADEPGFTVVGRVATASAALALLARTPVDVIVLSDQLDDVPGLAVLSPLRAAAPDAVLALWTTGLAPLPEGADIHIDRGATFRELVRGLRHAVRTAAAHRRPAQA